MRISDWSSDVCSSDLMNQGAVYTDYGGQIDKTLPNIVTRGAGDLGLTVGSLAFFPAMDVVRQALPMVLTMLKMALVICIRSAAHQSEIQSLMRNSYAVVRLQQNKILQPHTSPTTNTIYT